MQSILFLCFWLLAVSAGSGAPPRPRTRPRFVRGTAGLVEVPFAAANQGPGDMVCSAALAHWYSLDLGRAAPGGRVEASLWYDPKDGTMALLNGSKDRMPVQALWCGIAGRSLGDPERHRARAHGRAARRRRSGSRAGWKPTGSRAAESWTHPSAAPDCIRAPSPAGREGRQSRRAARALLPLREKVDSLARLRSQRLGSVGPREVRRRPALMSAAPPARAGRPRILPRARPEAA